MQKVGNLKLPFQLHEIKELMQTHQESQVPVVKINVEEKEAAPVVEEAAAPAPAVELVQPLEVDNTHWFWKTTLYTHVMKPVVDYGVSTRPYQYLVSNSEEKNRHSVTHRI